MNAIRTLSLIGLIAGAWAFRPGSERLAAPAAESAAVALASVDGPAIAAVEPWADDATDAVRTRRPAGRTLVGDADAPPSGDFGVIRLVGGDLGPADRPSLRALSGRRASRAPPRP